MGLFDDVIGQIGSGGSIGSWVFQIGGALLIFTLALIVVGVLLYVAYDRIRYNKKIVIFEKINGRFMPTRRDKAMEVRVGESGDTVFYLKKNKKSVPPPQIQTGARTYWYAVRRDGEWINIGMEDVDEKLELARVQFHSPGVRLARVGMQKNMEKRFEKITFMQKWGGMIVFTLLIVLSGVMMYLMLDKMIDFMAQMGGLLGKLEGVVERQDQLLANVNELMATSGLRK